jgi:hypothetical protein
MASELEDLMDKFAKDYDNDDIDGIIAYVRKQLAMYDAGIKPKRTEVEQLDMAAIVSNITRKKITLGPDPIKAAKMKRRI